MHFKRARFPIFDVTVFIFLFFVVVVTLYPFLNVLAISFNDSYDTVKGGIYIWPRIFTLENYKTIFTSANLNLGQAAIVSVARTVIGTVSSVICCCLLAYTLSRDDYVFRKPITIFFVITMYVSGGMIPSYLLIRDLHLIGSFWVYIIPGLVSFFNVIVVRSFIEGLPISIQEAARIDGANDFTIFYRIIIPLCLPVIATIALWIAVGQWGSWFDTYLYGNGKLSMSTLQFALMKLLDSTSAAQGQSANLINKNGAGTIVNTVSPQSIKMAITIVVTVPILLVYPFVQKYFVTGVTLGAVKG
ncbi:MAG TPA: carbohydrate ABC transporter permease [Clostridiaceae bacterium]